MSRLSHVDDQGRARMVDVADKAATLRECVARGVVRVSAGTLAQVREGSPKGDVLATARLAGIQAAKRTADWIPLAHPLPLDWVEVDLVPDEGSSCVRIEARVRATARTGVEMEALVAVAAAGLTVYDMCKAVDRGISLEGVCLVRKSGGKSGSWERPAGESPRGNSLASED
ncbi:MAG: cyclic pyranopterin monophosphate synthase MoaC [Myxococcota bacterium]